MTSQAIEFSLTSPAFSYGAMIPKPFTCQGENISPPVQWRNSPKNTQSFILIMEDPDAPAGNWVHWVLYNIPAAIQELTTGIKQLPESTQIALNTWQIPQYGGPCPPPGSPHRYFLRLYALDTLLQPSAKMNKEQLQTAMQGHIVGKAEWMGIYQRSV